MNGARAEMLTFVPADCRRLLDVGCGTGAFGELLKQTRKIEIWGVEPVTSAAEKASARLDYVINGTFDSGTKLPAGYFDCVVFNDVLEHMVAPEQALRYAKTLLSQGGAIVASIPNVRYLQGAFGNSYFTVDGNMWMPAYWTRRIFAFSPSRA